MTRFSVETVDGIGEVTEGTDLAAEVTDRSVLGDGDIVVVTSKVVSKVEGRVVTDRPKVAVLAEETDRVLARRGGTSIVRTHHGLVMAAAGIDASNTAPGTLVLLPLDPDASARRLRDALTARSGANVAVVVSDTSGRAWRNGQTDVAVGVAGLVPVDDHAGRLDVHGNELAVTAPAVADEIAGAGDLAKGKLAGTPVALVRGLQRLVMPRGQHGPGAAALVRAEAGDMFGLGAREAVMEALSGVPDLRGFGAPAASEQVVAALRSVLPEDASVGSDPTAVAVLVTGAPPSSTTFLVRVVCHAHAWTVAPGAVPGSAVCRPGAPGDP